MTTRRVPGFGATTAIVVLLALAWALVRCSIPGGPDPGPHAEVVSGDAAVKLVDRAEANLLLHVSNQSFADKHVRLWVEIDGVAVVDGDFHVEGQHNWILFPLDVVAGAHEITVEADSGAALRKTFEVPRGKRRHAVVDHWTESEGATLTWLIQKRSLAFD